METKEWKWRNIYKKAFWNRGVVTNKMWENVAECGKRVAKKVVDESRGSILEDK